MSVDQTLFFSQHSSNPLEAHTSDPTNQYYNKAYNDAQRSELSSSADPLAENPSAKLERYHEHLATVIPGIPIETAGRRSSLRLRNATSRPAEDEEQTPHGTKSVKRNTRSSTTRLATPTRFVTLDQESSEDYGTELQPGAGREATEDAEQTPMAEQYVDYQEDVTMDYDDDSSLTSLSDEEDATAHPEVEEREWFDLDSEEEAATISLRPTEEQQEIQDEIRDFEKAVPALNGQYELIDRLGTGTFSSVYKAIDLNYHDYDNGAWLGYHPPDSSAHFQSKPLPPPVVDERGQKRPTRTAFVAIKRIYVTSGPERIKNELAIMESVRGTRHVSQIITAYRYQDQVAIVMPYQRNVDFRQYFETLPMLGIKAYFRCLLRALRDIHPRAIIHRDVKPANFLFDPFTGQGSLCDFGLAQRLEKSPLLGSCLHTSASQNHPHGHYRHKHEYDEKLVKEGQQDARKKSKLQSHHVGVRDKDTRPPMKANRAGTRGFRAPEVLLKCGQQCGAVDVWSVGIILLFFLTRKFPVFNSNDDIEGLMELACVFGRRKMESVATLHARKFATNVPDIPNEQTPWDQFVEKLNPELLTPPPHNPNYYPYSDPAYQARMQRDDEAYQRKLEERERKRKRELEEEDEQDDELEPGSDVGGGIGMLKEPAVDTDGVDIPPPSTSAASSPLRFPHSSPSSRLQRRRAEPSSPNPLLDSPRRTGRGAAAGEGRGRGEMMEVVTRSRNLGDEGEGEDDEAEAGAGAEGEEGEGRRIESPQEAYERRWEADIRAAVDLVAKLLEPESVKRITPQGALAHPFLREYVGEYTFDSDLEEEEEEEEENEAGREDGDYDDDAVEPALKRSAGPTAVNAAFGENELLGDSRPPRGHEREGGVELGAGEFREAGVDGVGEGGSGSGSKKRRWIDDDDYFPHTVGEGVCKEFHFYDPETDDYGVIVRRKRCICECATAHGGSGCPAAAAAATAAAAGTHHRPSPAKSRRLGDGGLRRRSSASGASSRDGDQHVGGIDDRLDGEWEDVRRSIVAGEGLAIGKNPCEFHRDLVFSES